jgi:hypothetical protein
MYDTEHATDSRSIHSQLIDNNAAAIRSENRKLSWKVLVGVSVSIALLIGVAQVALNAIESDPVTSSMPVEPVEEVKPSQSATPSSPASATPTNPEVFVPTAEKQLTLEVAATRGNSNIDVVVGGEHVYKGPLFQGESKTFVGDVSISVYLGNAGDLDLTLNGEKLSPLGERNQEIRKTFRAK